MDDVSAGMGIQVILADKDKEEMDTIIQDEVLADCEGIEVNMYFTPFNGHGF